MKKVLLVLLCLALPFLAVLIEDGPSIKVLWAFLLQLCGHIPGVIYGIYQVVKRYHQFLWMHHLNGDAAYLPI
jgi:uncharacterized membrane protein YqaE (UPF0057 family)